MMNEYTDLINCYATAQTYAQLDRCERKAVAFTEKYGQQTALATFKTTSLSTL